MSSIMKVSIAFVTLVVICGAQQLSDVQLKKLMRYHTECRTSTAVDPTLIEKAHNGDFEDDAKLKEYFFCVSKKLGFQNEAGDLQKHVIRNKMLAVLNRPEIVDALIELCVVQKATPQQTSFDTLICYYESTPSHIKIL